MPDPVSEITDSLFERAAADSVAAPLADRFARAYRDGHWTVERLDASIRGFLAAVSPDVADPAARRAARLAP
jgi:hypothetical protein